MEPDGNNNCKDTEDSYIDGGPCAKQWQNAGPEECKKMFSLFDKTGIFIAFCCHHMVITACDMIKSGELCIKFCFHCSVSLLMITGLN